jgi:hypothetical protein
VARTTREVVIAVCGAPGALASTRRTARKTLIDFILFVDTESPVVHLYRRDADRRWQSVVIKGLDAVVELEKLKISLPLRDIYEGLRFRQKPKLVQSSNDAEPNGRSN